MFTVTQGLNASVRKVSRHERGCVQSFSRNLDERGKLFESYLSTISKIGIAYAGYMASSTRRGFVGQGQFGLSYRQRLELSRA